MNRTMTLALLPMAVGFSCCLPAPPSKAAGIKAAAYEAELTACVQTSTNEPDADECMDRVAARYGRPPFAGKDGGK